MVLRRLLSLVLIGPFVFSITTGALAQDGGPADPLAPAALPGTSFTYQGQLTSGGSPVTGTCDFQFSLFNASGGGQQQGSTQTVSIVSVANGRFTVTLNAAGQFGARAFDGSARWLAIAVRCPAGGGSFTALSPRQALTPAPLALALPGLRTEQNAISPNVIGGYISNTVAGGVVGATIGGGGEAGSVNSVTGDFGVIGGGRENNVDDAVGTIAGGTNNHAGYYATVGGGFSNNASGPESTIGGGHDNLASGIGSFIGGGGNFDGVSSHPNTASGFVSVIGGGLDNLAQGDQSFVGGGENNTASNSYATIAGGQNNSAIELGTVGGGRDNTVDGAAGIIAGGTNNHAGYYSIVGGGFANNASGVESTVAGGDHNLASGDGAFIGGGGWDGTDSRGNLASGIASVVGGGLGNTASGPQATVTGGVSNTATGNYSSITSGVSNTVSGSSSSIAGGAENTAVGNWSFVAGGLTNDASGDYSFAAGYGSNADHAGSFVWTCNGCASTFSSADDQFLANAAGGFWFGGGNTGGPTADFSATDLISTTTGAHLTIGGAWTDVSDRNAKTNFVPTDGRAVLESVLGLPVQTWNYRVEDASVRHIGPTAQDFYAAFSVGNDDAHIAALDTGGVALAAIQGLYTVVQSKDAEISALQQSNAALTARVTALENATALATAPAATTGAGANTLQLALVLVIGLVAGAGLCLGAFALGRKRV